MILYGHPLSGNTHKVRLLLSALSLPYEERRVDLSSGEHKRREFLALNPRGQLPALVDGEASVYDAQAILVYLARKYDLTARWLPTDPSEMARVLAWLMFAGNEIHNGAHMARANGLLGLQLPAEPLERAAHASLVLLETRFERHAYLELERPTLADLACFPCIALAPEGHVSLDGYPQLRRWLDRMRAQPFFVPMAGIGAAA